jgi:hypothetical protein
LINNINHCTHQTRWRTNPVTAYLHYWSDTNEVNKLDNNIWMLLKRIKTRKSNINWNVHKWLHDYSMLRDCQRRRQLNVSKTLGND